VVEVTANPFDVPFKAAVVHARDGGAPAPIPLGRVVICDCCNEDMTDDRRSGGFVFDGFGGLWAAGPCCAATQEAALRSYGEQRVIRGRCPQGVPFADWLRSLRGPDASIKITRRGES
jgi:hypothetical protein